MYGLFIFIGVLISVNIGERLCMKRGLSLEIYWKAFFYTLFLALIGARLYHVIDLSDYYLTYPARIIMLWEGGLGIWGAVIGGTFGLAVSLRNKFLQYADIFFICTPVAQAIGRWGNFFNRELFGFPTESFLGIYIPENLRPEGFFYYTHFHPLFLYESVLSISLFIFLYLLYKEKSDRYKPGTFMFLYLLGYSVIRIPLEYMRIERWEISGIPVSVLISMIVIITALVLLIRNYLSKT